MRALAIALLILTTAPAAAHVSSDLLTPGAAWTYDPWLIVPLYVTGIAFFAPAFTADLAPALGAAIFAVERAATFGLVWPFVVSFVIERPLLFAAGLAACLAVLLPAERPEDFAAGLAADRPLDPLFFIPLTATTLRRFGMACMTVSPSRAGVSTTVIPFSSIVAIFSSAVPLPPEMIAPA